METFYLFKLRSILWAVTLFYAQLIIAQNLVKNPSFEEYTNCPSDFGSLMKDVPGWYQPSFGTSDYFNSCSKKMNTDTNFIGGQTPYEGGGYAGLYMYAQKDYREYLTVALEEKLIKGKKYVFSFQVSLADKSSYSVNEFGIMFSRNTMDFKTNRNIPADLMRRSGFRNYVVARDHRYYSNADEWVEVTGIYIADGSEKFMSIGNFKGNKDTKIKLLNNQFRKSSYYYVDAVSLDELGVNYIANQTYKFEDLKFELDGYTIDKENNEQLATLINFLKAHRGYVVTIYGHTDDIGTKQYNKSLSNKRAKSVAQYLADNGLAKHRISYMGFGYENPLAKNKTTEARKQNRRVEFKVSRKKDGYASSLFED